MTVIETRAASPATAAALREPMMAVVIPAYRVSDHILAVLARIGSEVGLVAGVLDGCTLQELVQRRGLIAAAGD